jgi:hypothetical protein
VPTEDNAKCGRKRRYKYYPRSEEQNAKRRARKGGSWACERCDHSPFASIFGLQSHAVRVHGLHCDYRGHLTEFVNLLRCRKLMCRVLQSEPAEATVNGVSEKSPERAATSIVIGSLSSTTSELTGNMPSVGVASPEPVKSVTEDQLFSALAGSEPSLECRSCHFASSSPIFDLQTKPATDMEVIDASTALIGQRMGFLRHSEPRVPDTRAESQHPSDAAEEVVYDRSSPA